MTDRDAEIIRRYLARERTLSIAVDFDLIPESIYKIARRHGARREPLIPEWSVAWTARDSALIRWWRWRDENGRQLSTKEIGRRLGVTANAIIGRAHRLGLPEHQNASNTLETRAKKRDADAELLRLTSQHLTIRQIAARMGISMSAVKGRRRRFNASRVDQVIPSGARVTLPPLRSLTLPLPEINL